MVTNWNTLENIGPKHDVNGMDKLDIISILVEIESVLFIVVEFNFI